METDTFRRVEKKYLLDEYSYKKIIVSLKKHLKDDPYGNSTIMSLYLDTEDNSLIKRSLDHPKYKDKIRLRSYGIPKKSSLVYLEVKRKYKGTVAKRRVQMSLDEANKYLKTGITHNDSQIMRELDYLIKYYHVKPIILIIYDRQAYIDNNLRITIDNNIRYRMDDLNLMHGSSGKKIFKDNTYVMEIKALDAIPLWIVDMLTKLHIKPVSFSKYGKIYESGLEKEEINNVY